MFMFGWIFFFEYYHIKLKFIGGKLLKSQ